MSIWLDVWHKDIFDFLNLKTNNGDERMKAHDIFPGVCIPDEFMIRVGQREKWYLFCPHEVRQFMGWSLEDSWGEEWDERYQECIDHPLLPRVEVDAIDVMKKIMQSSFETGTPFIFFRDTVNSLNPNKHEGMIYCSNLCTEICQNMSPAQKIKSFATGGLVVNSFTPGDFVVCNLSSLNLGRVDKDEIPFVVSTQMRMMDNVIDLNFYPVEQARITNQKYRAVGLGVSGYHQHLAQKGINWESGEHLEYADKLFETINFHAVKASMEIAKEKGAYPLFQGSDWHDGDYFILRGYSSMAWQMLEEEVRKYGVRNGYMFAIAPTGSTSLIAGSTAGIDPVYSKFFVEEKKNGLIPQTAPNLNNETFWYYKEAHNIDQSWSIKAAAERQRHIDQSQSFNLYITPEIGAKQFLELFMEAWDSGMKTIYYVRNRSLEVDDCVSCTA